MSQINKTKQQILLFSLIFAILIITLPGTLFLMENRGKYIQNVELVKEYKNGSGHLKADLTIIALTYEIPKTSFNYLYDITCEFYTNNYKNSVNVHGIEYWVYKNYEELTHRNISRYLDPLISDEYVSSLFMGFGGLIELDLHDTLTVISHVNVTYEVKNDLHQEEFDVIFEFQTLTPHWIDAYFMLYFLWSIFFIHIISICLILVIIIKIYYKLVKK